MFEHKSIAVSLTPDAILRQIKKRLDHESLMPSASSKPVSVHFRDLRPPKEPLNEHSHEENFTDRGKAFCDGALLLVENLKLQNKDPLKNAIKALHHQFYFDSKDIDSHKAGKTKLKEYLNKLIALFEKEQNLIKPEAIFKQLVEAEKFSTWQKGRQTVVTVSESQYQSPKTAQLETQILVQVEIPRCRLTSAQARDYLKILEDKPEERPAWFQRLALWQQSYLSNKLAPIQAIEAEDERIAQLNTTLETIPTTLRGIPGLANYFEHLMLVFEKGELVSESHRSRSGIVTAIDLHREKDKDEKERLTEMNVAQLIHSSLSERIKAHAERWGLNTASPISIPLTIQTLVSPGAVAVLFKGPMDPSNDDTQMYLDKNKAVEKIVKALANVQKRGENFEQDKRYLNSCGLTLNEAGNLQLKASSGEEYLINPIIISTNNAVNPIRNLPDVLGYRKDNDKESVKLLQVAAQFLSKQMTNLPSRILELCMGDPERLERNRELLIQDLEKLKTSSELELKSKEQKQDLQMLIEAMRNYLEMPKLGLPATFGGGNPLHPKNYDPRHRELFLSSLEQIITEKCGGIGYGSCKSGKDRKALEVMHTDSMHIYFTRYGSLPHYHDDKQKRANFTQIFTDVYFSRHQEESAHQNAPGSRGLKEIHNNLPGDFRKAIEARHKGEVKESNAYGKLNKVDPRGWFQKKFDGFKKFINKIADRISGFIARVMGGDASSTTSSGASTGTQNPQATAEANVVIIRPRANQIAPAPQEVQVRSQANSLSASVSPDNPSRNSTFSIATTLSHSASSTPPIQDLPLASNKKSPVSHSAIESWEEILERDLASTRESEHKAKKEPKVQPSLPSKTIPDKSWEDELEEQLRNQGKHPVNKKTRNLELIVRPVREESRQESLTQLPGAIEEESTKITKKMFRQQFNRLLASVPDSKLISNKSNLRLTVKSNEEGNFVVARKDKESGFTIKCRDSYVRDDYIRLLKQHEIGCRKQIAIGNEAHVIVNQADAQRLMTLAGFLSDFKSLVAPENELTYVTALNPFAQQDGKIQVKGRFDLDGGFTLQMDRSLMTKVISKLEKEDIPFNKLITLEGSNPRVQLNLEAVKRLQAKCVDFDERRGRDFSI